MMDTARKKGKNLKTGARSRYICYVIIFIGLALAAFMQTDQSPAAESDPPDTFTISGTGQEASVPRRHFRLRNPADLKGPEAEAIYNTFKAGMARAYATSGVPAAREYQKWQRYNVAPFKSAAHGRRFVNHYANARARAYGDYEKAGILPVGSIIAKDNLTVLDKSKIYPGALLLMEKMPAGFNYVSGDWRYTMIMPDGSIFGTTKGVGSKNVRFCIGCHLAAEKQDHLYFPPKQFRRQ